MRLPLVDSLQRLVGLSETDVAALDELTSSVRVVEPRTSLIEEGQRQSRGLVIVSGWAMRYFLLPDGKRQILRFLVRGDLCDPSFFAMQDAIHSIETITSASVASFSSKDLLDLFSRHPRIAAGFWWLAGREQALLQHRLVMLGRYDAFERMADLLWTLWQRCELAGLTADHTLRFPLLQSDLADALGLTVVHVNRVLRRLREAGLVHIQDRKLVIRDPKGLQALVAHARGGRFVTNPCDCLLQEFGSEPGTAGGVERPSRTRGAAPVLRQVRN